MNRTELGKLGEKLALKYLQDRGYKALALNYRVSRLGEIDIIASMNERICFIEVKTRTGNTFGTPAEAVSWKKQRTIRHIAECFLKSHSATNSVVQFDVVEVFITKNGDLKSINHLQEVF